MAKILVNLTIPAISESYDLLIPDFVKVRTLIPVLTQTIEELAPERYRPSGKEFLCSRESEKVLDKNTTLRDNGIQNGDHLMIF